MVHYIQNLFYYDAKIWPHWTNQDSHNQSDWNPAYFGLDSVGFGKWDLVELWCGSRVKCVIIAHCRPDDAPYNSQNVCAPMSTKMTIVKYYYIFVTLQFKMF